VRISFADCGALGESCGVRKKCHTVRQFAGDRAGERDGEKAARDTVRETP
jgi:hypothetical protein